MCNPNCFAKLIVEFYHVCADIQRPLMDAPWLGNRMHQANRSSHRLEMTHFATECDGDKCISCALKQLLYELQCLGRLN